MIYSTAKYRNTMNYYQIQAPEHLKSYIRSCWVLESANPETPSRVFKTMADGCPGLIFQPLHKGILCQDDKKMSDVFVFGQTTKHAELHLTGSFDMLGIYFYPNALKAIFGFNPGELTNSCLDLNDLAKRKEQQISEQLLNTASVHEQFDILFAYLTQQIRDNYRHNHTMEYAMAQILKSKGGVSLKEVQKYLQLSERSMERRFKEYIGISPKLFSRICRFQASLLNLRNNNFNKLTDIAYEHDYADQSHFIRSFKEFAGVSPLHYQKRSQEIVENLAAI
jgi:AraC-like DNA-binding protein